jgi:thiamine-phosphate pyrophosphorylase
MKSLDRISGLYAITPTEPPRGGLEAAVAAVLDGGARVLQYRDKSTDAARRLAEASALAKLARDRGATFIVNDDVELALAVQADGVHLGRDDSGLAVARARLGASALIGVSCYDQIERAEAAAVEGADYVAFGSVFPSPTKPHAPRADLALIAEARRRLSVPIVAIGGITPENAAGVRAAGADAIAVISALFASADIEASARRFAALFEPHTGNETPLT